MVNRIAAALRRGPWQEPGDEGVKPEGGPTPSEVRRRRPRAKAWVLVVLALALGGAAAKRLAARGVPVDTAAVARGTLRVTVSGSGKARVRERHEVSAPVAGRLRRIALQPGDAVKAGQVLSVVDPSAPAPLDERSRAAQRARLAAAVAAEAGSKAALQRARVAERAADSDWDRSQRLSRDGALSAKDIETFDLARRSRQAEREMAEASLRQAQEDVVAARAVLLTMAESRGGGMAVVAPVDGRVLRVIQESEGVVQVGAPLLELGDVADLEVAVDLLTTDAVRVAPGDPVQLQRWGGDRPLAGVGRRVDPSGFTKVSALGVEEQRVFVVVGPKAAGTWARLADNYRVEAEILVAEKPGVLRVPVGSLIRGDAGWSVFAVESGKGRLRPVQIGEIGASEAEVLGGLSEGTRVVLYPGEQVMDGVRLAIK